MTTVQQINNSSQRIAFKGVIPNNSPFVNMPSNTKSDLVESYLGRNKNVYVDYAEGDISFLNLLTNKITYYWDLFRNQQNTELNTRAKNIETQIRSVVSSSNDKGKIINKLV